MNIFLRKFIVIAIQLLFFFPIYFSCFGSFQLGAKRFSNTTRNKIKRKKKILCIRTKEPSVIGRKSIFIQCSTRWLSPPSPHYTSYHRVRHNSINCLSLIFRFVRFHFLFGFFSSIYAYMNRGNRPFIHLLQEWQLVCNDFQTQMNGGKYIMITH